MLQSEKDQAYSNLQKQVDSEREAREEREAAQLRQKEANQALQQPDPKDYGPMDRYVMGSGVPKQDDPYLLAKQAKDYSFLNAPLTQSVTKKLEQSGEWKDNREAVPGVASIAVANIQLVRAIEFDDAKRAGNEELLAFVREKYPAELSALKEATSLRGTGADNQQILEYVQNKLVPVDCSCIR